MSRFLFHCLAISFSAFASAAYAGDDVGQSASPITLERPVGVAGANAPVISLGTPIPVVDPQVRPTDYQPSTAVPLVPRPLPSGTPLLSPDSPTIAPPKYVATKDPPAELAPQPTQIQADDPTLWYRFTHFFADDVDSGSDCGCCGACDAACIYPGNRFYVNAEALTWWFKGQALPPLVTSGSINDSIPGALGQPGTQVLFGGRDMENGAHAGTKIMMGYWFGEPHGLGFEVGFFLLGPSTTNFSASSDGTPILTRPFIDAATNSQTAQLVAGPNVLAGTVTVQTRSSLWGTEANFRTNLMMGCDYYWDLLAGFKGLGLDDDLRIGESLTVLRSPGGSFELVDHFSTQNRFYGGQIGTEWECRKGRWTFNVKSKLAVGATNQLVQISGNDLIIDPTNGPHSFVGGLLAQQSNIGHYSRDMTTIVPEMNFTLGYQLTPRLRCFAGYNILYWSSVARTGSAVDVTVNQNQIAPPVAGGPARPAFSFSGSDFWAQGVNIGLEYRW